jgi:hypothetical protein
MAVETVTSTTPQIIWPTEKLTLKQAAAIAVQTAQRGKYPGVPLHYFIAKNSMPRK